MSFHELSIYEKLWLMINKRGDYIVMSLAFIENANKTLHLTQAIARSALAVLQKRHPFLRAFINDQSNIEIKT